MEQEYLDCIALVAIKILKKVSCILLPFTNKSELLKIISDIKMEHDVYYYKIFNNRILFVLQGTNENYVYIKNKDDIFYLFSSFLDKKVLFEFNKLSI